MQVKIVQPKQQCNHTFHAIGSIVYITSPKLVTAEHMTEDETSGY